MTKKTETRNLKPAPAIWARPMLMCGEMVRATLADLKTETRRMVKTDCLTSEQKTIGFEQNWDLATPGDLSWVALLAGKPGEHLKREQQLNVPIRHPDEKFLAWDECATVRIYCPYGSVGARIWVKETFQMAHEMNICHRAYTYPLYRATDPEWDTIGGWKWKPSIFMPRRFSRILLEITSVRVERLQEITREAAIAEGLETHVINGDTRNPTYRDYLQKKHDPFEWYGSPIRSYQSLWEKINGLGSWAKNPWVWVVQFKRLEMKGGQPLP